MQYKIVVDKQSRKNPSAEKREYVIDIPELHYKGNVYDSLIITLEEDYVLRRFELIDEKILKLLDEPKKEPLEDVNIELFEGENYIYLADLEGNQLYAEYLLKNDFTERYVMQSQLQSAIEQLAGRIDLSVNEKLEGYYNSSEIDTLLSLQAGEITASLSGTFATKDDLEDTETTLNASLSLKLDREKLISEINASADRISLNAGRLVITSGNFKLDANGNITAIGGTIGGFTLSSDKFSSNLSGIYNYTMYDVQLSFMLFEFDMNNNQAFKNIYDYDNSGVFDLVDVNEIYNVVQGRETNRHTVSGSFTINTKDPKNCIMIKQGSSTVVSIGTGGINSTLIGTNFLCISNNSYSSSGCPGIYIDGNSLQIMKETKNHKDEYAIFGRTLYSNSSGSTGTITLNDSISNYSSIEIYYTDDLGNMKCEKIYNNNNSSAKASLTAERIASNTLNSQNSLIAISGTTLSRQSSNGGTYTSWDNSINTSTCCPIRYVLGYE